MREMETDPGWAQRLKDRRAQRRGDERIVRWIATPASQKRRVGGRGLEMSGIADGGALEARMLETRMAV